MSSRYSIETEQRSREFSDFLFSKVGYTSYISIAQELGVTGPVVGAWVKGEFQPRAENLGKLAATLNLNEAETYYLYTLTNTALHDNHGHHLEKAVTAYYRTHDISPDELIDDFLRAVRTFGMATQTYDREICP